MIRGALLLIALGGCDKLFDLDHISGGQAGDGGSADGDGGDDIDAFRCDTGGHNEDGDTLVDVCDGCPTILSTQVDTDLDGLPDACDRDDASPNGDTLLAYWTFATSATSDFTIVGSTSHISAGNGALMLNGASITTKTVFVPTRVELHLSNVNLTSYNADLQILVAGTTLCHFRGANCSMGNGGVQGCVQYGALVSANWAGLPSAVRRYSVYRMGNNLVCDVGATPDPGTTAAGPGGLAAGTIGIALSAAGTTQLEAIAIYGVK